MLLFAACCLTTRYITDKYTVLRLFSRPNYADSSLNSENMKWLPTILYMHCIFGLLMLSVPSIFPKEIEDLNKDGKIIDPYLYETRLRPNSNIDNLI